MANVPLKSITFPGLSDTYTVPQIDNTLTTSGKAADAKVVGDQLGDLKSAVVNQTVLLTLIPNKYILRNDGSEAAYNGWTATDYIAVPPKQRLICHTTATLAWGARYNENKEYVEAFGWTNNAYHFNSTDKTVYFRTSGANAEMSATSFTLLPVVDTSLSNIGYAADAKAVGDALDEVDTQITGIGDRVTALESEASGNIPSYYETQLATKEATIRGHFDDCALDGDGFVFITDTHYSSDFFTSDSPTDYFNSNHSPDLIKHIINKTGISTIVFGGDLLNSTADVDTMLMCMASFGVKFGDRQPRLRFCVGNHEYFTGNDYGQTTKPSASDLYGAGIKYNEDVIAEKGVANTYYYDNVAQKIRYFVVSCGRDTELTKPQVAWVLDKFEHIPDGYKIVVIGHAFINDAMTEFRGYYANIMAAMDALNSGTTYTFDNTEYDYTYNHRDDQTQPKKVTVVCAITGHTHTDGYLMSTGDIPCICTVTDSWGLNTVVSDGTPQIVERTQDTTDEQAFDVVQFDFTGKKIYCTRIGYGSDRTFSYP